MTTTKESTILSDPYFYHKGKAYSAKKMIAALKAIKAITKIYDNKSKAIGDIRDVAERALK